MPQNLLLMLKNLQLSTYFLKLTVYYSALFIQISEQKIYLKNIPFNTVFLIYCAYNKIYYKRSLVSLKYYLICTEI